MKTAHWTVIILVIVAALVLLPLVFVKNAEWGGADGNAESAITQVNPDYEPWFSPLWEPPSAEIESLLFALQAAIGAGLIAYAFGYWNGNRRRASR